MKSVAGIGIMLVTLGGCLSLDFHSEHRSGTDEFASTATVPVTRSIASNQRAPVSTVTPAPSAPAATMTAKQPPEAPQAPVYIVLQPSDGGTPTAQIVTATSESPVVTKAETTPVAQAPNLTPPTPPSQTFGNTAGAETKTPPATLPELETAGPILSDPKPLPAETVAPQLAPVEATAKTEAPAPQVDRAPPAPIAKLPSLEEVTRRSLSARPAVVAAAAAAPPTMHPAEDLPVPQPPVVQTSAATVAGSMDSERCANAKAELNVQEPPLAATPTEVTAASPVNAPIPEIKVVNSKRVSLRYQLSNQNPDIGHVELWCTRDGRSWTKRETHAPVTGACSFDLDDEDLYGLSLIVRGRNGMGRAPVDGDQPQVWLEVDLTKPTVRLMGVDVEKMAANRQFTIRWRAADKNLGANPVSLHYAPQANGPWKPIATQLENSGQYVWSLPADAPKQIYVRVQATDKAGNVGDAQTKNAIEDTSATPTVAIQTIEAIDE